MADALAGLEVTELAHARRIADVGSGAGLPGVVLATSLAGAEVDMIESSAKKCAFMEEAIAAAGIANAHVVAERSETWAAAEPPEGGRETYDAVTIRAVGSLATDAELASPLLQRDGVLVVWKGARRSEEEAGLERALPELAMALADVRAVTPYRGSRNHHLYVVRKTGPTPEGLPRRPGLASRRPLGARRAVG